MKTEGVSISDITVPAHRARGLDTAAVDRLADSITRLGLQTPITVRYDSDVDDILLVAGLHRLEAARKLGWDKIPAIYTDGTADEARMWEIAENLHRAELSAIERAEHINEWRALSAKVRQDVAPSGGVQPKERGIRHAARELGVSEATVRRAEQIANLPPDVKEQAAAEQWSQTRALAAASPNRPPVGYITEHKMLSDFETYEAARNAVARVLNRIPEEWRRQIFEELIDTPVFDRGQRE
jgi:ParB/RepB/Spo0J family partition protein